MFSLIAWNPEERQRTPDHDEDRQPPKPVLHNRWVTEAQEQYAWHSEQMHHGDDPGGEHAGMEDTASDDEDGDVPPADAEAAEPTAGIDPTANVWEAHEKHAKEVRDRWRRRRRNTVLQEVEIFQSTRDLPDTSYSQVFEKPCFHAYGRNNTAPMAGGLMSGEYMVTHNVAPQLVPNHPSSKQVYRTVEHRVQDRKPDFAPRFALLGTSSSSNQRHAGKGRLALPGDGHAPDGKSAADPHKAKDPATSGKQHRRGRNDAQPSKEAEPSHAQEVGLGTSMELARSGSALPVPVPKPRSPERRPKKQPQWTVGKNDPRQYKHVPVEWTRHIMPAGFSKVSTGHEARVADCLDLFD